MSIFSLTNFNLQIHNNLILENASFSISTNEKVFLIGANGVGKTSLMNYVFEKSNIKTGYAKQDISHYNGDISEFLTQLDDWWEILELSHKIFNFEISHHTNFEELSGGEKMKISICIALQSMNKIVLLDEPTNHLDTTSSLNLRKYVKSDNRAYLIISHDIDFINDVANKVMEIENKNIITYGGNYDFYKAQKQQVTERKQKRFENNNRLIEKLEAEMKSKLADSARRKDKMKKKIKSGNSGIPKIIASGLINKGEGIVSKELNKLETRRGFALENLEDNKVVKKKQILFKINENKRRGKFVTFINSDLKINGAILIKDFNFEINSEDRILITGQNGAGKSVLAKNLFYNSSPNVDGKSIYGSEYSAFLLDQNFNLLNPKLNALENFQNKVTTIPIDEMYKYLFSLNFNLDNMKIPVENLSGGEKLKLIFAILNASNFDLLILDEPTNNLDIQSKEVLIEILNEFGGSFVLISHDSSFIKSINFNKMYNIENTFLNKIL